MMMLQFLKFCIEKIAMLNYYSTELSSLLMHGKLHVHCIPWVWIGYAWHFGRSGCWFSDFIPNLQTKVWISDCEYKKWLASAAHRIEISITYKDVMLDCRLCISKDISPNVIMVNRDLTLRLPPYRLLVMSHVRMMMKSLAYQGCQVHIPVHQALQNLASALCLPNFSM